MMFRTALAVAVIGLAAVSIAYAALPGRVVASKSATGQFAVTAVNATVKKPKGILGEPDRQGSRQRSRRDCLQPELHGVVQFEGHERTGRLPPADPPGEGRYSPCDG